MEKKIVFFDIDGTIIDNDTHKIPESTREAIGKMRRNGHIAVVNTGRTWVSIDQELKEMEFDGYICGCGTYIWYQGEWLLKKDFRRNFAWRQCKNSAHGKCRHFMKDMMGYTLMGMPALQIKE